MKNRRICFGTLLAVTVSLVGAGAGPARAQPKPMSGIPAVETIPRAYTPSMTLMPQCYLIAAFAVTQNGQSLYIDTRGKVIGRMAPGAQQVIWNGSNPFMNPTTVLLNMTDPLISLSHPSPELK